MTKTRGGGECDVGYNYTNVHILHTGSDPRAHTGSDEKLREGCPKGCPKRGYTFIDAQIDITHPHCIVEEGDVHQSVSHYMRFN